MPAKSEAGNDQQTEDTRHVDGLRQGRDYDVG